MNAALSPRLPDDRDTPAGGESSARNAELTAFLLDTAAIFDATL